MTIPSENILLLDIEKQLDADSTGEVKRAFLHRLETLRQHLQLKLRGLHDRSTFREINASLKAVDGAILALQTIKPRNKKQSYTKQQRSPFSISAFVK